DEQRSQGGNGGGTRAGFFERAGTQVVWAGSFVHAGPEAVGRASAGVYEGVPRITSDFEFDCDVQRACAERLSSEYRRDTTAVRTDPLPAGAVHSRKSRGWNGHRALLQLRLG